MSEVKRKKKPRIEPVDEVIEHLESMRIETMGPMLENGRWKILLRSVDASPGTPPASIEAHDIEGEGLYVETKDLKAAVRSAKRRQKPHRARSFRGHANWIPLELAFPQIDRQGAVGHVGADQQTGDWWIHVARCVPDGRGHIRCVPMGNVPVGTLPDGRPGVDEEVLEEVLDSDAAVNGFEDDDEE